jgi:hypothetical protein
VVPTVTVAISNSVASSPLTVEVETITTVQLSVPSIGTELSVGNIKSDGILVAVAFGYKPAGPGRTED